MSEASRSGLGSTQPGMRASLPEGYYQPSAPYRLIQLQVISLEPALPAHDHRVLVPAPD